MGHIIMVSNPFVLKYRLSSTCILPGLALCIAGILKEITLHFIVYKNQADPHCLANQTKLNNRHLGLGVPPSVSSDVAYLV